MPDMDVFADEADALEAEVLRLRTLIENAPHDSDSCARTTYDGYDENQPCTCWKAGG